MTDAEIARERKRVKRLVDELTSKLKLTSWDVRVTAMEKIPPLAWGNSGPVLACECMWWYRDMKVMVNASETIKLTDGGLVEHVAHELVHMMINEMREWLHADAAGDTSTACAMRHEERVATELTPIMVAAYAHATRNQAEAE